ncbi:MAG: hypothetical protein JNM22_15390 [Saprospiraceae bacterium]|nr:hypothetical protein [Saprospiraceae bacterium]
MRILYFFLLLLCTGSVAGQKMLLLEKANRAKTVKMYIGETLQFRLNGPENYWYERTITDILPESNVLLLDNFPVKLDSISNIKVYRRGIWRITGASLVSLGGTLALATTVGRVLYNDKKLDLPKLYSASVVSFGAGMFMLSKRKLKLGQKHRLRIVEIKFPEPLIAPPPIKKQ